MSLVALISFCGIICRYLLELIHLILVINQLNAQIVLL